MGIFSKNAKFLGIPLWGKVTPKKKKKSSKRKGYNTKRKYSSRNYR